MAQSPSIPSEAEERSGRRREGRAPRLPEIGALTGLRGVAAMLVLTAHSGAVQSHIARPMAFLGMSIFFMLSGVVMSYTYADAFSSESAGGRGFGKAVSTFFKARFARLAPLYYIVGVGYFLSTGLSWDIVTHAIPRYALAVQSWFYVLSPTGPPLQLLVYPLSWSISTEWFLYFLVPFISIFALKNRSTTIALGWIVGGGYVACYGTLAYISSRGYTGTGYPDSQNFLDWLVYLSPYGRILDFLSGMIIGRLASGRIGNRVPGWRVRSAGSVVAAVFLCALVAGDSWLRLSPRSHLLCLLEMGPMWTPFLILLLYCLSSTNNENAGPVSSMLRTKPMLNIGMWSYSIYLLQGEGWAIFGGSWPAGPNPVRSLFGIGITLLLAAGSYIYIESPARAMLRNMKLFGWLRPARAEAIS